MSGKTPSVGSSYGSNAMARPGGYGGLGRDDGMDDSAGRDTLLSGGRERYATQQSLSTTRSNSGYSRSDANNGSYDGYGEQRELTEEEKEAEEERDTRDQTTALRNDTYDITNRLVQMTVQTGETVNATMNRLNQQGNRLHNTEKNLDVAANHNKIAETRTKELKVANRSMFAIHVDNPFTSKQRAAAQEKEILDRHRYEREQREATQRETFADHPRMEGGMNRVFRPAQHRVSTLSQADRSRFAMADDLEGEETEEKINENLDIVSNQLKMLNRAAHYIGETVDEQNKMIDRITSKVSLFNSIGIV